MTDSQEERRDSAATGRPAPDREVLGGAHPPHEVRGRETGGRRHEKQRGKENQAAAGHDPAEDAATERGARAPGE